MSKRHGSFQQIMGKILKRFFDRVIMWENSQAKPKIRLFVLRGQEAAFNLHASGLLKLHTSGLLWEHPERQQP